MDLGAQRAGKSHLSGLCESRGRVFVWLLSRGVGFARRRPRVLAHCQVREGGRGHRVRLPRRAPRRRRIEVQQPFTLLAYETVSANAGSRAFVVEPFSCEYRRFAAIPSKVDWLVAYEILILAEHDRFAFGQIATWIGQSDPR